MFASYDQKRLEAGGKNIYIELPKLCKRARELVDENPVLLYNEAINIALDEMYPPVNNSNY